MTTSARAHFRLWIGIAAVTAAVICAPAAGAQTLAPAAESAVAAMQLAAGGSLDVTISPVTKLATFVSAPPGRSLRLPVSDQASPTDRALAFLGTYGAAFGIASPAGVTVSKVEPLDEVGMDHVRLRQVVNGVPVTGGEITVHLRGASVVSVHAKTLADLASFDTTPTVGIGEATARAQELLVRRLDVHDAALSEPRLEIFNRGHLQGVAFPSRLAWFIEARRADLREFIWVDAKAGVMLLHFSQLADARNRTIYSANNTATLPGTKKRIEGQPPIVDNDVNKAYDFSGDTYDYFFSEFGRDSYDGLGSPIISTVHYCPNADNCPYQNAFWNGAQMVYGEGFSVADDVDAHELTHAVTEHTAGLLYYMQSGALNESFSDIFGETVDQGNLAGTDTTPVKWLLGEDVPGIGAIRDMWDPTAFGDPGKMSDPQFYCTDTLGDDAGGVHHNSGVPNHAYALMVDGGSYNGVTIQKIGLTKAGKIQFRALSHYLVSASDFLDDYNAVKQSCTDLIGTAAISSANCTQVGKALDAVKLNANWPCLPAQAQSPTFCGAGQGPENFFLDDLENVSSGRWNTQLVSGSPDAWTNGAGGFLPNTGDFGLYFSGFSTSPIHEFWAYDQPSASDSTVRMAADVHIPNGGAFAYLKHSYGFDNDDTKNYDGGVIEYSTAGANGPWTDAGSLINGGASYGGTLAGGSGNPLAGRSAFVRESYGYTATRLNLATLANKNVRFRFRVGTDSSVDDLGWFIDDVRFYTCGTTLFDDGFESGNLTPWDGHVP